MNCSIVFYLSIVWFISTRFPDIYHVLAKMARLFTTVLVCLRITLAPLYKDLVLLTKIFLNPNNIYIKPTLNSFPFSSCRVFIFLFRKTLICCKDAYESWLLWLFVLSWMQTFCKHFHHLRCFLAVFRSFNNFLLEQFLYFLI